MFSPREFYKEYWLTFYFWLNEHYLYGPAWAGVWIKLTHITRLIMNVLKIALYTVMSAALPLINLVLMAINSIAIFVGSPSNTVKIQTYYNTEWELQLLNNAEGNTPEQEPPHGILHSHPAQQWMLFLRYLHDLNGFSGSIISIVIIFSALLTVLFGVALFSSGIGEILTLVALISGVASALGITYTYKNRLRVHTQNINDQIKLHYDYSRINNPTLHGQVEDIMREISNDNYIKQDKYYEWIRFRCYRAVKRALESGFNPDIAILKDSLKTVNFKNILVNDNGPKCTLLDGLAIWEERLYQQLICQSEVNLLFVCDMFEPCKLGYPHLFINYFKSAWLKEYGSYKGINNIDWKTILSKSEYISCSLAHAKFTFNKDAIKDNQDWAVDTSHGKRLLPTIHIKKLAEKFVQDSIEPPSIKQQALDIWYAAMPKIDGEYIGYDDHDPKFHGVMTFTLKFLIEALNNKLTIDIKILKDYLNSITEESSIKKFCGFAYKAFNLKNLKANPNNQLIYCTTPWLTESSVVYSALKNA
jgi:hypothetical protein